MGEKHSQLITEEKGDSVSFKIAISEAGLFAEVFCKITDEFSGDSK
jgi:hypothetical protein